MIKFEEHDNQLFRMLEEPVPLTPDAEMPCLVRLIQDDSPMGRYNRDAAFFDVTGKLFIAQKIKENPLYRNTLHAYEKRSISHDYCIASIHTLEVIGYPVAEGSHRGEHRTQEKHETKEKTMIKFKEQDGVIFKMLKEPVPLKEKDTNVLVQFITHGVIGEYVMEHWLDCNQKNLPIYIDDVDSDGDVTVWIDENRNEHHCCPFPMFEIIGTLVKEGSKDWALYQMMQGKKVCHQKLPSIAYYKHSYGIRRHVECNYVDNYKSIDAWLNGADESGWQLYEPEPQYKVGDWVEVECQNKPYHKQVLFVTENRVGFKFNGTTPSVCFDGTPSHIFKFIRKLKPSEVEVDFGSGIKGWIRRASNHTIEVYNKANCWLANIRYDMLDTETSKLVEGLLNAQEEKC